MRRNRLKVFSGEYWGRLKFYYKTYVVMNKFRITTILFLNERKSKSKNQKIKYTESFQNKLLLQS